MEMVSMRKKAKNVQEAMPMADDSSKRPRMEQASINNVVTNPISTSLPLQNIHVEIHYGEDRQDVVHVAEQEKGQHVNFEYLPENRAEPLVTRELVGGSFKRKLDEIWSSLMEENVLRFGICGMGGAGKTELAKHIHNKLLEDSNFGHVYWVTVSPDFSIHRLQNAIAEALNLDLSNKVDVNIRAASLSKTLAERKKLVLILDDVWSDIPLDNIGITDNLNGCKLLLTARSLDVCHRMDCQKIVEVDFCERCHEDAWELFIKQLGKGASHPRDVESGAKSFVKRCGGFPLMIISLARRMRRVKGINYWWNSLEELKGSKTGGGYFEVFHRLKLSYDHLEDPSLQQFLLYCELFDRFHEKEVIEHLIAEGIIEKTSSIREKNFKGHAMLYKLLSVCLLQDDEGYLYMHELVRKMAFQIMNKSLPSIIEIGTQEIKYLPDKWHCMENILTYARQPIHVRELENKGLRTLLLY